MSEGGAITKWGSKIFDLVNAANPPGAYQVIQIQPDREKQDFYHLAGSEAFLVANSSLFLAIRELLLSQSGSVDLKKFIENFEKGFPDIANFKDPKLNDKLKPWGRDFKDRPRIFIRHEYPGGRYVCEFILDGESLVLWGTAPEIVNQIAIAIQRAQQLEQYDLGAWVGYPVGEYLRQFPQESKLTLIFRLKTEKPIHYKTVRVPFVSGSVLNYRRLREVCGGDAGLQWGKISVNAKIGKGEDIKKLSAIYAAGPSESEAKKNLKGFLSLTSLPTQAIFYNQGDNENKKDRDDRTSYKVYPCSVGILNQKVVKLAERDRLSGGRSTYAGKVKGSTVRFLLTSKAEPPDFQVRLNELLLPVQ
ncbi:hypothetical protein [Laspinema olomoucense]|uniref:hypothetical protein n=1 Tax=Laspinema olomoucense TaxID=3231600 RepID=UPI0021BA8ACD|nr:hypothetical protein [Laspinema sp. D3d]MCT7971090.1 hypothetical protein [Laspinema sp. D3d]